ncbi:MAG: S41 family peptidase [Proteiniphilum sp.]|nr:S41 family peptidase [Proteiniphilum sp.]
MKAKNIILFFIISFALSSCGDEAVIDNNPDKNFDALWRIIDENYCFFEYKNIGWNQIYREYKQRIKSDMGNDALFTLMGEMLSELKDGHVNLMASHDMTRYWSWMESYPSNFDTSIQDKYLGTDFSIAGGLYYKILEDNIGYIYYGSFSRDVGEGNISQVLRRMSICKGIIFDIRGNGGGSLTNVERLASRFFNERTQVGYIAHKTGKGHEDFSKLYPKYVESSNGIRYQKPVVVLTNRGCYSAANDFVNVMKNAPNATIIGDKTGGGSGLPFSSELPNGWSIRFSASPMYNINKEHIEFGIEPDIKVEMLESDKKRDKDTIIEKAREIINTL